MKDEHHGKEILNRRDEIFVRKVFFFYFCRPSAKESTQSDSSDPLAPSSF